MPSIWEMVVAENFVLSKFSRGQTQVAVAVVVVLIRKQVRRSRICDQARPAMLSADRAGIGEGSKCQYTTGMLRLLSSISRMTRFPRSSHPQLLACGGVT